MVTLLDMRAVKVGTRKGLLKYGKADPEQYMESLRKAGFVNVVFEANKDNSKKYESILAHKPLN